jgi:hypothetical protein
MRPCKSTDHLLNRQTDVIRDLVKDAVRTEQVRKIKLSKVSSDPAHRKALEERFTAERCREQENISRMLSDLEQMKKLAATGEFRAEDRKPASKSKFDIPPEDHRFRNHVYVPEVNQKKEFFQGFNNLFVEAGRQSTFLLLIPIFSLLFSLFILKF